MEANKKERWSFSTRIEREKSHIGKQIVVSNQVDTLQVVAQQDATVAVAVEEGGGGIVENRNKKTRGNGTHSTKSLVR